MGRGRGRGRQGGGGFEDQYGEGGHSQDRQEHSGFAGRGGAIAGTGGGDAGDYLDFYLIIPSEVLRNKDACARHFQVPATVLAPAPSCGAEG
jgi:hypothetical protein